MIASLGNYQVSVARLGNSQVSECQAETKFDSQVDISKMRNNWTNISMQNYSLITTADNAFSRNLSKFSIWYVSFLPHFTRSWDTRTTGTGVLNKATSFGCMLMFSATRFQIQATFIFSVSILIYACESLHCSGNFVLAARNWSISFKTSWDVAHTSH